MKVVLLRLCFCLPILTSGLLIGLSGGAAMEGRLSPAAVGAPQLVPVAVFGPDNRGALSRPHRELKNKIGLLYETRSRSVCTAFCVGQNIVATASHCLFRTEGEPAPKLSGFIFNLNGAEAAGTARIAGAEKGYGAMNVISGSTRLSITPPIQATRDWALVKLAKPVCKTGGLRINTSGTDAVAALAEAGLIYQVAYHRDLPHLELAQGGPCWMRGRENPQERATVERDFDGTRDLILHTCDTGGASSGSPLLIDTPSGPEVVGINVGTYIRSKVLMQYGEVLHRYKSDAISNTAVGTGAFADTLDAFAHAEILDSDAKVRKLQDLLLVRGYYDGPRDGRYGPMLKAAIENYERAERRPALGLASHAILNRLIAQSVPGLSEMSTLETGSIARSSGNEPAEKPSRKNLRKTH
jgi:protease YdgD